MMVDHWWLTCGSPILWQSLRPPLDLCADEDDECDCEDADFDAHGKETQKADETVDKEGDETELSSKKKSRACIKKIWILGPQPKFGPKT